MRGEILSSHRPYICLNRPGVVLLGFGDLVDIVANDFRYLFGLVCPANLVDFIVANWVVACEAQSVLTSDVA